MRQPFLLALLALATIFYFWGSPSSAPVKQTRSAEPTAAAPSQPAPSAAHPAPLAPIVIAGATSYQDRWKAGPTAQSHWKTGPKAQTDLEPFPPSEQSTWNQSHGYTIVAGRHPFRR